MDAVWLVGPLRQRGDPLRYSIRSVVTNLPQVTRIVTVGHRWPWLTDVLHIPVEQQRNKHESTYANLRAALADDRVSGAFVLMNDDFFIMHPVARVPVWHRGPIAGQIANHKRTGHRSMLERRRQHMQILTALGVEDPLCYELHVPMPVDRAAMTAALDLAEAVRPDGMEPTGKRTLYGNLAAVGGAQAEDVKIRAPRDPLPPGALVSTDEASWRGRVGQAIRAAFRTASPCERR